MKLGAFTTFMPEYTFPEACRLLKALGYDGVQPRIVPKAAAGFDPAQPFNPWGNNKGGIAEEDFCADPRAALQPAADAGLSIASVASYTSTENMARAVALVKACGRAGIRHVRVGSRSMPKEARFDIAAYLDRCRGEYRELVQEAKPAGVRPCLELHMGNVYPSASGAMALLRGFAPDEVGVLYDPGNMIWDGWEAPKVALNVLGPYLAELHVKNSRWVPGDTVNGITRWHPEAADLENGCVNWAEIIEQLKIHRYEGWLIEEGHTPGRGTYDRLKLAGALLRTLI